MKDRRCAVHPGPCTRWASERKANLIPPEPTYGGGTLNFDAVIQTLKSGKLSSSSAYVVESLITTGKETLTKDASLVELQGPVNIVGDIHGQYEDLLKIFKECGAPGENKYLFLGDYVDRGPQDVEVMCLLLAYKVKYPNTFFLLRGNHETENVNMIYGFFDKCKRTFGPPNGRRLWSLFNSEIFDNLPIAALVDQRILCVHGGLSPKLVSLEQINKIGRPTLVPDSGLLCDLLWSDPDADISGWAESSRGVAYTFGADVVGQFLEEHDLDLIVRAHQVVECGYELAFDRKLVTIFSARNYAREHDNDGAVMRVVRVDEPEGVTTAREVGRFRTTHDLMISFIKFPGVQATGKLLCNSI